MGRSTNSQTKTFYLTQFILYAIGRQPGVDLSVNNGRLVGRPLIILHSLLRPLAEPPSLSVSSCAPYKDFHTAKLPILLNVSPLNIILANSAV